MDFYALSQKGTDRITNDDSYIAEKKDNTYIFAIADGVGQDINGAIASKQAIKTLRKNLQNKETINLKEEIDCANQTVLCEGDKHNTHMATTLVACLLQENTGRSTIAHVGNSRAYIIDDTIWRTKDHSLLLDVAEAGIHTDEVEFSDPEKHQIKQVLGLKNRIDVEVNTKKIKDSILLMCSNGLNNYVPDPEIAAIARQNTPKNTCDLLLQKARENGSTDDITIIVAHVKDSL
jgi:protein phosphatase